MDGSRRAGCGHGEAVPCHSARVALGPIPQGWEVGRLDDVLTLQRGFDLPTPDRNHGKYPVIAASGPNGCHDKFMVCGPGVTTGGRSGVLGKVFFIHEDFWPLNTSLWVKEFNRVSPAYAFHLLHSMTLKCSMQVQPCRLSTAITSTTCRLLSPRKPVVEAFNALVMRLMKQQKANEDQSRILATLQYTAADAPAGRYPLELFVKKAN